MTIVTSGDKTFYMDGNLEQQLENKIKPNIHKKDKDWVCIIDGPEGSGKSVLAQQIGKKLDPSFNISRMCMNSDEFTKAIIKSKKGQCIIFDEAFTGLSSRGALSEINRLLVSLMMEMRQKNLFVIIVMPTYFELERYVALFRARGLFHVYEKNNKRGYWIYFNRKKKKYLYLKGKKMYDYNVTKCTFLGRFHDQYTIDEQVYREKKTENLIKKSRTTKAAKFMAQRNVLIWILYKKYKLTQLQISGLCNQYDYKISRQTISDIIMEKRKQELSDEIELEANNLLPDNLKQKNGYIEGRTP